MVENQTILIGEDDDSLRYLTREALESEGFSVIEASDGGKALELARAMKPSLIILDVGMPTMDGFEVCSAIRGDPSLKYTPVLIITGLDDAASIDRAYRIGATSFSAKPVNWQTLPHDVRYILRNSHIEAELRQNIATLENAKRELEETGVQLTEALSLTRVANVAKSQFLAAMSHELRTPLNAIIGFSEILKNQVFGPVGHERYHAYHEDIFNSGTHLLSLINEILDTARIDAGKLELRDDFVSLNDVAEQCLHLMAPQAATAGVRLSAEFDPNIPDLRADTKRVRQILFNLLSNAVKFTGDGGEVKISTFLCDEGLTVSITDTGIGMAPHEIAKALEPFGQVDSTLARRYEGAGLGLPLAMNLIRLHGGKLTITSATGVGTVVSVLLPMDRLCLATMSNRTISLNG